MKGHIRVIPSLTAPITPSAQQGNANYVAYTSNTGSYSLASNTPITKAIHIDSTVCISVNGVRRLLTDSNTSPFFFSRNGGSTQLLLTQVEAGDSLYIRPAYLEHGLETTDLILLEYFSGGTVTLTQPSTTHYWTLGTSQQPAQYNLIGGGIGPAFNNQMLSGIQFSKTAGDQTGSPAGDVSTYLNSLSIGTQLIVKDMSNQTNTGTFSIVGKQSNYNDIRLDIQYISGVGNFSAANGVLWSFQFMQ
jgi:hypothetical protein